MIQWADRFGVGEMGGFGRVGCFGGLSSMWKGGWWWCGVGLVVWMDGLGLDSQCLNRMNGRLTDPRESTPCIFQPPKLGFAILPAKNPPSPSLSPLSRLSPKSVPFSCATPAKSKFISVNSLICSCWYHSPYASSVVSGHCFYYYYY